HGAGRPQGMDRRRAAPALGAGHGPVIRVCFHGAESTGKSTLARKLADRFGCPLVPEYGRIHAEERGTEFTLGGLLGIAREQDRLMHAAARAGPPLRLLDTDPLLPAARAGMLLGGGAGGVA